MSNLLKTLNKNNTNQTNEKFNPDISNLYSQINQTRQTTNYNFTNEGYKTIINEKINKPIKYIKINNFLYIYIYESR